MSRLKTIQPMTRKHTPGPWRVNAGAEYCFHTGNRFAIVHDCEDAGEHFEITIAEVWPASDSSDGADARLIAEAPAMSELLSRVFGPRKNATFMQLADEYRALLARIDGE